MAVVFALCSAIAYGLSDFVGGLISRRTSAWSVAAVAQLSATASTAAIASLVPGSPRSADFAWAVLAGTASGVGTGFLYRGFASGRMAVVAPISAVGAALVPTLVGTLGGERPSLVVWLGVVCALPGIWLVSVSSDPSAAGRASIADAEGVTYGVLAGLGFGVLFAALGQVPEQAGLWPLAAAQAVSVPTVIALALVLRAAWRPRGRTVWWALLAGPLGATATGAFLLATQSGFLKVAGVLASLYPATKSSWLHWCCTRRSTKVQGVGLALCALAIGFVAGG